MPSVKTSKNLTNAFPLGWDGSPVNLTYQTQLTAHTLTHTHTHTHTQTSRKHSYLTHYFPGERVFNSNKAASNHLHAFPWCLLFPYKTIWRTRLHTHTHTHTQKHTCAHSLTYTHMPSPNTHQLLGQRKIYISSQKLRCLCTRWVCLSLGLTPVAHLIRLLCMCVCVCLILSVRVWERREYDCVCVCGWQL